jgi:sarcosine oxidase subunit alpha
VAAALANGTQRGAEATNACGFTATTQVVVPPTEPITPLWLMPDSNQKAFVDFQHDVAASDVALAHREGYRSVEHLKRYTTLGMATDQGRTANVNGLAIMAALTGQGIAETGTTRHRPPYTPVALGALAGHHRGRDFRPVRLTSAHEWAKQQGAIFTEAGAWMRAQYFPRAGETDWLQSVIREVNAVRQGVGLCDVSTLGKIELVGADAGTFLDRIYANTMGTLPIGRARYGLMLREDGFVMDDGTVARLGPDRYVITTTTAQAEGVLSHLEYCHQVLWPDLDLHFVSTTDRWAQFAIAGPKSRAVLQNVLESGTDISDAAFPFMAAAELRGFNGVRVRLFRVSFSGDLAYEIAVPAPRADAAVRALMAAGAAHGITAYGTEAMGVMRIEKGHVAGGELNGQTTARDLGLERMLARKKDYIGRALQRRPALQDPARPMLVGLRPVDRSVRLRSGAHFLALDATPSTANDQGWISSVAFSPTLGHWIGLGLLANGPARHGERLRAYDALRGGDTEVEITAPCQIDPEGVRLRG